MTGLTALRPEAVAVRIAVVVGALAALALVPSGAFPRALMLIGALVAAAAPRRVGAAPFVLVAVVAWAGAYGRDAHPPVGDVVLFAVLVHLVLSAAALAAAVPLDAHLTAGAATRWAVSAMPGVALAAAVGGVAGALGALPGRPFLDLVGGVGVVVALAAVAVLLRRRA